MSNYFKSIVINAFLCIYASAHGQDISSETEEQPILVLKSRVKEGNVYLRWGVNDKTAWRYGNEYGYDIERVTIFRDGVPLKNVETKFLNGSTIKPKPVGEWKVLIEKNDMAAIAAQAIYGEKFSVNDQDENAVMKVINQSSELQQRFAFSMFAIDQSFEAAQYAGLGYIDTDIKLNERYLYIIKMAVPDELLKMEEISLLLDPAEKSPLPKPFDFAGYFYNDAFVLIWEYDDLQYFYNSYDLERSEEGRAYSKVNSVPITKLADTDVSGISYTDNIPLYEKKYWYRIRGNTIFDEKSQPSDTISVIARKKLLVAPEFGENVIISYKEVVLKWKFDQSEAWKLTGFDISRADKAIGPYINIAEDLDSENRSFGYDQMESVNYFKVRAKGIAGDYQDSSPNMVQPIDSIPPKRPLGLLATIDTTGIVRLTWSKNTELDLKGYALFRANRPNQEFTKLNKQEILSTTYEDSINLKSFNKKVYYKLTALDNRYNESLPSDILELERPDKIPPTNALFKDYELTDNGVLLKWEHSSSDDVVKQIIYRNIILPNQESMWQNIFETQDVKLSEYIDTEVEPDTKYLYTIVALDRSNLESDPSPPISVRTTPELLRPAVKGLYSTVDRENGFIQLSWRYNEANVAEIHVFKKEVGNDFTLHQTLEPGLNRFLDSRVTPNTRYIYGLRAIFKDGGFSKWSKVEVTY